MNIVTMTKEDMAKIENARLKYKPDLITILLIAEAPPDSLDRFFYYKNVRKGDYLFLGITEAIYPDLKEDYITTGRLSRKKAKILNLFKDEGLYLIDISDTPISLLNSPLEGYIPALIEKVNQISDVNTKIILIKANVYDLTYERLSRLGYDVINKRIPFPSSGQQTNFQRIFAEALASTKIKQ